MKKLLLILLVLITPSVHSVSNQDLLDRLDEIEFEREMNREIDRINRETDRSLKQFEREMGILPNQPRIYQGQSPWKLITTDNSKVDYFIDTSTIKRSSNGQITFIGMIYSNFPRYRGGTTFFYSEPVTIIYCNQSKFQYVFEDFYSNNGKKLKRIKYDFNPIDISPNTTMDKLRSFVCR